MSSSNGRSKNRTRVSGEHDAPQWVVEFFKDFLSSPAYRHKLKTRILAGEAHHIEILGHYYAFGNPTKRPVVDPPKPEMTIGEGLRYLTTKERRTFADLLFKMEPGSPCEAGLSSMPNGFPHTPNAPQGDSR